MSMPGSDARPDDGPYEECSRCGAMIAGDDWTYGMEGILCPDCDQALADSQDLVDEEFEAAESEGQECCCDCVNGTRIVERYATLPTGDLFVLVACECVCHQDRHAPASKREE